MHIAAIPFQETLYNGTQTSVVCAAGIWQFMPETAKRMGLDLQFKVLDETRLSSAPSPNRA